MPEPKVSQTFKFRSKQTGEEYEIPASSSEEAKQILVAQMRQPQGKLPGADIDKAIYGAASKMAEAESKIPGMGVGVGSALKYLLGDNFFQQMAHSYGTTEGLSESVYHPALETGMSVIGNLAGTPAGPGGMALGGGAGYATGAQMADVIDNLLGVREPGDFTDELEKTAGRTALGTAFEMAPMALTLLKKTGQGLLDFLPKRQVENLLASLEVGTAENTPRLLTSGGVDSKGVISAGIKGMEEAPEDIFLTLAQTSKSPTLAREQRYLANSTTPTPGGTLPLKDTLAATKGRNVEAIENRMTTGKPGTWIDAFSKHGENLQAAEKEASEAMEGLAANLGAKESETTGQSILAGYGEKEQLARETGGRKFEAALRGTETEVNDLVALAKDAIKGPKGQPALSGEQARDLKAFIKDAKKGTYTGVELQGVYRNLGDLIGRAQATDKPLVRRLTPLYDAMNTKLASMGGGKFNAANTWWKDNVVEPFILAPGAKAAKSAALTPAQAGEKFFRPGEAGVRYAQDLKNTLGEEEARNLIRQTAGEKLIAAHPGLESAKVSAWVKKHEYALREYGLYDEMMEVATAATDREATQAALEHFTKSPVAKQGLEAADTSLATGKIFAPGQGPAEQRLAVREMLGVLGDDAQKVAALKNDVSEMLLNKSRVNEPVPTGRASKTGGETIQEFSYQKLSKVLDDYAPALEELYTPAEMASLKDAKKWLRETTSGLKEPGSDTALKLQALNVAQGLGNLLVSMPGPFGAMILRPSGMIRTGFEKKANQYMFKVLTDPEYAQTFLAAGMDRYAKRKAVDALAGIGKKGIAVNTEGFLAAAKERLTADPELRQALTEQLAALGLLELEERATDE